MRQALGLYIHIPFCKQKCKYCDFYSVTADPVWVRRYTDAVINEMDQYREQFQDCLFDTLFIGGGTPSVIGSYLVKIVNYARKAFHFTDDAEMTCEANPESLDYDLLAQLKEAGINRISMGAQSFCNDELQDLGRIHDKECIIRAYRDCIKAGFTNINVDIMFGIGHQKCQEEHVFAFSKTLEQLLQLDPPHISCYNLTVQEHTVLHQTVTDYKFASDESEDTMYDLLCRQLQTHSYEHYEISNFAKPNFLCRHNLKYWNSQPYLGLGPAAHSFIDGVRYSRECSLENYIAGNSRIITEEQMSESSLAYERLVTGLRLKSGVSFDELAPYFNLADMKPLMKELSNHGLGVITDTGFALTEKGFRISNSIICRLSDYYKG